MGSMRARGVVCAAAAGVMLMIGGGSASGAVLVTEGAAGEREGLVAADPPKHEFVPLRLEQASPSAVILEYVVVLPDDFDATRSYPTLLALPPGAQNREMVEAGLRVWEAEGKRRGWVIISPAAPNAGTSSVDPFFKSGYRHISALLDEVGKTVKFEGGKVHVGGISNGGRGAFRVATELPARVASVIVLPGALNGPDYARLAEIRDIPVTLYVGGKDVEWVREGAKAKDAIEKAGGKVTVRMIENAGHAVPVSPVDLYSVFDAARPEEARRAGAIAAATGSEAAVAAVLDAFHAAAAKADGATYFDLFVPDSRVSVFIGTDATERWSLDEFRAFAKPYFENGKGWTYAATKRTVTFVPATVTQAAAGAGAEPTVAFFDELLDNAKYGVCRGSGVLVRIGDRWRIAQYNLSKPIPNERMEAVLKAIEGP